MCSKISGGMTVSITVHVSRCYVTFVICELNITECMHVQK